MNGPYDDIIRLPRHVSATHPQMPVANRAAQFMPFAALTGYDAAILETARLTGQRIEPGQGMMDALERKLNFLAAQTDAHPDVTVTYFKPDGRKDGGTYVDISGTLKKIDDVERVILLKGGARIPIADMMDIDCELFEGLE